MYKSLIKIIPKYIIFNLRSKYETYLLSTPEYVTELLFFLKTNTNCRYRTLIELSSVDYPKRINRFEINYHLLSVKYSNRINIKTYLDEMSNLKSVTKLFSSAAWSERELWDLFGIYFEENSDLRRILTDYGFEGHALRKDFPLSGYYELIYDNNSKMILNQIVEVTQEFRLHQYTNTWI